MTRRAVLSLLSLLAVAACSRSSPPPSSPAEVPALTVEQVAARLAAGDGKTFVYDDNPRDRYDRGHVPGAQWLESGNVTAAALPADREATLIFYCASEA